MRQVLVFFVVVLAFFYVGALFLGSRNISGGIGILKQTV